MDGEDPIVVTLGELLVQVRTARRALEDVERATSRYTGFEFTKALSEGADFGAPPMFQGALMVHVVNINDLAPGNTLGGILEALFGGIGNFVGGLVGGAVGGFWSALSLPDMVKSLEQIAKDVRAIIAMTKVPAKAKKDAGGAKAGAEVGEKLGAAVAGTKPRNKAVAQAATGETLTTTLTGIKDLVKPLTALFTVAAEGEGGANKAGKAAPEVLSQAGERWMAILHGINVLLDRLMHVVDGLIILIPNVVGAIALFVDSLGAIRREVLETIRFILRNVLVLRGVLLSTLFDIVAAAARLAAAVVATLGTTIESVLASIIDLAQKLIGVIFDALSTMTNALKSVIQGLLRWLVTGVFRALRAIGSEPVFRTIDHMIRILPSLLGPIHGIIAAYKNNGATLSADMLKQLKEAHKLGMAGSSQQLDSPEDLASHIIEDFPDFGGELKSFRDSLSTNAEAAAAHMKTAVQEITGDATKGLKSLAGNFDAAAGAEVRLSDKLRRERAAKIRQNADALADAVTKPIAAEGPATGLEAIAKAYQDWLTSGEGLKVILDKVDTHFRNRVQPGGKQGAEIPALLQGRYAAPSASVEIKEVEILIEPPPVEPERAPAVLGPGDFPLPNMSDEAIWMAYRRHSTMLIDRNLDPNDDTIA